MNEVYWVYRKASIKEEPLGIIHECVVCGESEVVDMSGWCMDCHEQHTEEDDE
jgi:hypothetical protein